MVCCNCNISPMRIRVLTKTTKTPKLFYIKKKQLFNIPKPANEDKHRA